VTQAGERITLPNFFIVGAPKAGTDELFYDLDQHPDIYTSPLKEPCYFSSEIRPQYFHPSLRRQAELTAASTRKYLDEGMQHKRFGGIISDPRDYQRLFSAVTTEKAIGEGSVCYLWSNSAPAAIASAVPHARIIIVLMDPSERAFHQYLKSVSDGTLGHSFRKHLRAAMLQQSSELNVYHPFLAFGNYFDQVRRYIESFPSHQLNISLFEDMRADHRAWFARVLSFLEVDTSFTPQHVDIPSTPHVPRFIGVSRALRNRKLKIAGRVLPSRLRRLAKQLTDRNDLPELRPKNRAILVEYYRDDILRLQDLIGRDLSGWLR
jgi:hypothetical protein